MRIPKVYWQREDGWAASTTAIIAAVVAAAGAATSAVGTYASGQVRKQSEKYNAQVAQNNARLAQEQAAADAQRIREKGRRIMGAQRAALASAGVDPDAGSAVDIGYDSSVQNELDALTALYKGNVAASGSIAQSQLDTYAAKAAGIGGALGAGGTLLSGAAGTISTYNELKTNPKFEEP